MPDEKKKDGIWSQVIILLIIPILLALTAGGTAPWWWDKISKGDQPPPTPSTQSATTSPSATPTWLRDGKEIELQTQSRWLDGRTRDGTVGLASSSEDSFTGTRWKVHVVDDGNDRIIMLETLGAAEGLRWLDGGTGDGAVRLASSTEGTGTQWKVHVVEGRDDQTINLETLGATDDRKWLDGITSDETVGLANSTKDKYIGTHWRVVIR